MEGESITAAFALALSDQNVMTVLNDPDAKSETQTVGKMQRDHLEEIPFEKLLNLVFSMDDAPNKRGSFNPLNSFSCYPIPVVTRQETTASRS